MLQGQRRVRLPPARALTGEVQSRDRQVPDGSPWRQPLSQEVWAVSLGLLGYVFLLLWLARPNDLNRTPSLTVRPNELVFGVAIREASGLFGNRQRDPFLFNQPLGDKGLLFGSREDLPKALPLDHVSIGVGQALLVPIQLVVLALAVILVGRRRDSGQLVKLVPQCCDAKA